MWGYAKNPIRLPHVSRIRQANLLIFSQYRLLAILTNCLKKYVVVWYNANPIKLLDKTINTRFVNFTFFYAEANAFSGITIRHIVLFRLCYDTQPSSGQVSNPATDRLFFNQ